MRVTEQLDGVGLKWRIEFDQVDEVTTGGGRTSLGYLGKVKRNNLKRVI